MEEGEARQDRAKAIGVRAEGRDSLARLEKDAGSHRSTAGEAEPETGL